MPALGATFAVLAALTMSSQLAEFRGGRRWGGRRGGRRGPAGWASVNQGVDAAAIQERLGAYLDATTGDGWAALGGARPAAPWPRSDWPSSSAPCTNRPPSAGWARVRRASCWPASTTSAACAGRGSPWRDATSRTRTCSCWCCPGWRSPSTPRSSPSGGPRRCAAPARPGVRGRLRHRARGRPRRAVPGRSHRQQGALGERGGRPPLGLLPALIPPCRPAGRAEGVVYREQGWEGRVERTAEEIRLREAREGVPWRAWGPYLSERQWGTVREDYSDDGDAWDYFTPRPGSVPGLPLGRGRPGRHQRRQAAAVLRHRAVERAGPDPQGAAVRPDQLRGQPRRGRQGVLLLPRQPAHPLLPALALQVPAGGVPVRGPRADQPVALARPRWSTSCSTPGVFDDEPLLRRRGRVREGRPHGHRLPHHRAQPGSGRRADPPAAHALVPQHLVMAAAHRPAPAGPRRRASSRRARRPRRARLAVPPRRARRRAALLRERDRTPSGCGARPTRRRT